MAPAIDRVATTVRLPADVDARLGAYCASVGATKNRVTVLALRAYLDGGAPPLRIARDFEPTDRSPRAA